MKNFKVAIDVGHNPPQDLGAINEKEGLAEFVEAHEIVSHVYKLLYSDGFQIVNFAETLKRKVEIVNAERSDIAIEVHLNNHHTSSARGLLALYYPTENSRRLAQYIVSAIKDVVDVPEIGISLPTRGIKVGYYRLDPSKPIIYFLRKTKCPAVVLEPLFLSNEEDLKILATRKKEIAAGIFLGVKRYYENRA